MARYAELHDGTRLEFPDDTPDEAIQRAVRTTMGMAPERPGALERGVRGIGIGLKDAPDAVSQAMARAARALGLPGSDQAVNYWDNKIGQRETAYQRDVRGGQGDFDWGRFAGNTLGTAPITAAIPAADTMVKALKGGAAIGAVSGALQPVTQGDFWTEKLKQTGLGGIAGAITGPVGYGASRVISPKVSPEVQMLQREGVTPTPGQAMGGGWRAAEEKAKSIPILGAGIRNAEQRATEQFNVAAVNRALAPVGAKLPDDKVGSEAVEFARQTLRGKYDEALTAIGPVKIDAPAVADMNRIYSTVASLPKDKGEQFVRILQNEIFDRAKGGRLTPDAMKAAESNLGNQATGYMGTRGDYDTNKLGEALDDALDALRAMVARQAPPEAADALKAANTGWANFKRVQRAASYTGAEDGVFNPSQLHGAVRATDRSKDHARFASGDALMQDLSKAGKKALTNKVPNSGTADRLLGSLGLLGGAAYMDGGTYSLPAAGLLLTGRAAYSPMGQKLITGALTRRPEMAQPAAEAVLRAGLLGGPVLTPTLQGLIAQ